MKTLFDEPIYKSGPTFYQETGRSRGIVNYRWRYVEQPGLWRDGIGCSVSTWTEEVIKRGVIDENAV